MYLTTPLARTSSAAALQAGSAVITLNFPAELLETKNLRKQCSSSWTPAPIFAHAALQEAGQPRGGGRVWSVSLIQENFGSYKGLAVNHGACSIPSLPVTPFWTLASIR